MTNTNDNSKGLQDRTKAFAIQVIGLVRELPKSEEARIVGRQLLRSATSVGANTRAAFRGRSRKEFIAKTGVVIEEADESGFWLEILEEADIFKSKKVTSLKKEAESIVSIFVSIVNRSK